MNKLRLLLRLQRVNTFRLNEIRFTRDKKQKRRLIMMLVLYPVLALLGLFYSGMIAWGLDQAGLSPLLPAFALLLSTGACLMLSVIRSPALFFNPAGWDTLLALPFPQSALIWTKLANLYFSAVSLSFIVALPHAVFYSLSLGLSFSGALVWLSIALFAPLLPMSLGIAVAAIPALLLQRLKNKSLVSTLLVLPFITWLILKVYTLPMDSIQNMDVVKTMVQGLEASLQSAYPPLGWILRGMAGELPSLIKFIALNMVVFGGTSLFLLLFFQASGRF